MFLGLQDPDPDPLGRGVDPDPSIIKQNSRKTLILNVFLLLLDFLSLKNHVKVHSKSNKQKNFFKNYFFVGVSVTKIVGSASASRSGSISQRHGSADPDPHQNVIDPEHCFKVART
jgi:hypothetical protein